MRVGFGRWLDKLKSLADGGLLVFCLAFAVYVLTVGPDVSLWDSGEFVCCAVGLDVGHPPGAPLYWLILRIATMLVPAAYAALACSVVSALCCAGAAAVLSLVVREVLLWWAECSSSVPSRLSLFAAQTSAGLAWAWADSVWAVAVETEVYGAASLLGFSLLLFALRWRHGGDGRLLALACLFVGLLAGVHWLGWLMLPLATAVVGERWGRRGMVMGFLGGCVAVPLLAWLASGHFFDFAALCDFAAVNVFCLPVGVGWAVGSVLVVALLLGLAAYWRGRRAGACALALLLVSVGFLSFAIPLLRGGVAAVSVSSPSDAQRLSDYMRRSQYGSRPLFYGPTYASRPDGFESEVSMRYDAAEGRYVPSEQVTDYSYPSDQKSLFPRMSIRDEEALWAYNVWASPEGWPDSIPSLGANIRFLLSYQMGHMMARYVMWNFCGRQNSRIGDGGYLSGNFICGIPSLDRARIHLEEYDSPAEGRYVLFGIPLILILIGCVLTVRGAPLRISLLLFAWVVVTGPALAFYVDMPPYEPRERDYIFILLFAALCVFLGFALWRIYIFAERWVGKLSNRLGLTGKRVVAAIAAFAVPTLMAVGGFAPHDRSGDTLVADMAKSVLDLCPADGVIVVGGDNDTYPLWYAQEVLDYRRDVRVVNFGLLSADWYVASLVRAGRGNAPLRMRHADLAARLRLQNTWLLPGGPDTLELKDLRPASETALGQSFYLPSDALWLSFADTSVVLHMAKESLDPAELLLLEMAAENSARRICLMPNVVPTESLGLRPYLKDIGPVAYLVPDTNDISPLGRWQLFNGAMHLPDSEAFSPSSDEIDQLDRLCLRRFCNDVAEDALARADVGSAVLALRSSLSWLPISLGSLDAEELRTARLLHRAGEKYLARRALTDIASRCSLTLRRAQALAEGAPATSRALVDGISPLTLELVDVLRETGNDDVALGLANLIRSLPVAQ